MLLRDTTVAQSCGDQPALSVQPTAVAAGVEGGTYSFDYTIINPASDGEISASTSATWISVVSASNGEVTFTVDQNTGDLRSDKITVTYTWSGGSISDSVTVVQDHEGGSGGGDYGGDIDSLVGTYTAAGYAYYDAGVVNYTTWTLTIYKSGDNEVTIDGLVPEAAGTYPSTEAYVAKASLNSAGQLVIPSQYTGYMHNETGYYIGWTPCVEFSSSEGWYYDPSGPDCILTYNSSTGVWTSDYGMFLGLFSGYNDFSTFEGFFDVTNPGFQISKSGDFGSGYDNYGDMTGTYSASATGMASGSSTHVATTWDMYITAKSDTEYYVYCLTPYAGGLDMTTAGTSYWASGHWGSETTFVIPSQVCSGRVNTSDGLTLYLGYTPCIEYESGQYYYSGEFPSLTFTNNGGDTWESDFGVFTAGFTSTTLSSLISYFGVVAPTITITKTSSSVPSALSASGVNSGRSLGAAETYSNFKTTSVSVSESRLVVHKTDVRAVR